MNTMLPPPRKKRIPAFAVGASVLIHMILLFFIGGAVLIQSIIPKRHFMAEEVTEELPMETIEETATEVAEPLASPPPMPEEAAAASRELVSPEIITAESTPAPTSFALPSRRSATTETAMPGPSEQTNTVSSPPAKAGLRNMSTLFGSKGAVNEALVGYLYDLKQTADKKDSEMAGSETSDSEMKILSSENKIYHKLLADFITTWNPKTLDRYLKSKDSLSSYQIFIPVMQALEAPKAFGVEKQVKPRRWVGYYQGQFVAPTSGQFRFVGFGDDILVVRFNRKLVLDASFTPLTTAIARENVVPNSDYRTKLYAGEWFNLSVGQSYPIEILTGEEPGGDFCAFLMIEQKGATYEKREGNKGLKYPVFQMAPTRLPKYKAETMAAGGGPAVAGESFSGNPSSQ